MPELGRYLEPDPLGMQGSARYFSPEMEHFLSEDLVQSKAGANPYQYAFNNPTRNTDPLGLFVVGEYNKSTGFLTVTDLDTNRSMTIPVESGGKPWGASIPSGCYDIVERAGKPEFRLDKQDNKPFNDVDDDTGRSHFRLHKPGRTIGCIAAKNQNQWDQMYDLISKTPETGTHVDLSVPWWKELDLHVESITVYGTLCVY